MFADASANSAQQVSLLKAVRDFDFTPFWNQESPAFGLPRDISQDF